MACGLHCGPLLYREAASIAVTRLAVTFCRTDAQGEMKEAASLASVTPVSLFLESLVTSRLHHLCRYLEIPPLHLLLLTEEYLFPFV